MANPAKGEIPFKVPVLDDDGEATNKKMVLTLKFTNAGRRAAEDVLNMEQSEIEARLNTGRFGARITSAMLYGATRKHHARQYPSPLDIDALMDALEEEKPEKPDDYEDRQEEAFVALVAAYNKSSITETEKRLFGRDPGSDSEAGEDPKDGEKAEKK